MDPEIEGIDVDQIGLDPSDNVEQQPSINEPVEEETIEQVRRREQTYKGAANDLRKRERELTAQLERQSKQVQTLLGRLEQLEGTQAERQFERDMQDAARAGWTAEEQQRARALFQKEQALKRAEAELLSKRPMVEEAEADRARNNYIRSAIQRANASLQKRNIPKTITLDELVSRFQAAPQSMGEVDAELQEIMVEAALAGRGSQQKQNLAQRAASGTDKTERGTAGAGRFEDYEALYAAKKISRVDFLKKRAEAIANGEINY